MNYNQFGSNAGNPSLEKRLDARTRWEKQRAEGKWFWLFKRSAIWLTSIIFMFSAAIFLFPETVSLQGTQLFIGLFMFGGYFIGSLNEWAKMEKLFQGQSFSNE